MAKLPCLTNGTTVIKTQDLLIIMSMELSVIHSAPWHSAGYNGHSTESEWVEAGIPSLSRLSWPEQPSRTHGVHFLECGKRDVDSREGTQDSSIPLCMSSAVVSNSALAALIKFFGKSFYHWQSWERRGWQKVYWTTNLTLIEIYKTLYPTATEYTFILHTHRTFIMF